MRENRILIQEMFEELLAEEERLKMKKLRKTDYRLWKFVMKQERLYKGIDTE